MAHIPESKTYPMANEGVQRRLAFSVRRGDVKRSRVMLRRAPSLIAALALTVVALVVVPDTAFAASTGRVLASPCLNQRATPGGTSQQCIPNSTTLAIACVAYGPAVTGPYGTETIWDRVSYNGVTGYVSDAWMYTGSNGAVAPACGTAVGTREDRAVAWANSMVGSQSYRGLCELFVENAFGTSGRYASALAAFYAMRAAGQMHYTLPAPRGALVFSRTPVDMGYGHVQLSRGDGSYVSGGMGNPTVQITYSPSAGSGTGYYFLGWSYAPGNWPGR